MSVKTIFKWLILPVVAVIIISVVAEYINVAVYSSLMRIEINKCIRSACGYFTQETYKNGGSGTENWGNMGSVVGISTSIDGNFYVNGNDLDGKPNAYNALYKNNYNFNTFASNMRGEWSNLDNFANGSIANTFIRDGLVTPINMGITYLDTNTVRKIAIWNIAAVLSRGNSNNVYISNSTKVVRYNGFEIDVENLDIQISYKTYNLTDDYERAQLDKITNMNTLSLMNNDSGERNVICVATLEYELPIRYIGISPIKEVFSFSTKYRVRGIDNGTANPLSQQWNNSFQNMSNTHDLINNKIIYYIIR